MKTSTPLTKSAVRNPSQAERVRPMVAGAVLKWRQKSVAVRKPWKG